MKNEFLDKLAAHSLAEARKIFLELDEDEQVSCLDALYQQSMNATKPAVISVLFRKLKPGKTFKDFHQAWLPAPNFCDPVNKAGTGFMQAFPVPTRVINAQEMEDPSLIVSVGLTWLRDEKEQQMMQDYIAKLGKDEMNQTRSANINTVAEKQEAKICITASDDNLGTPF